MIDFGVTRWLLSRIPISGDRPHIIIQQSMLGLGTMDSIFVPISTTKAVSSRTDKEIHVHEKEAEYTYTKGITAQGQKEESIRKRERKEARKRQVGQK
jgi:hypothetical protein